jgi:hypothetical protein
MAAGKNDDVDAKFAAHFDIVVCISDEDGFCGRDTALFEEFFAARFFATRVVVGKAKNMVEEVINSEMAHDVVQEMLLSCGKDRLRLATRLIVGEDILDPLPKSA